MISTVNLGMKNGMCPMEDKVRIKVDQRTLKRMQDGHGGWSPDMGSLIGKQLELKGISFSLWDQWKSRLVIYGFDFSI